MKNIQSILGRCLLVTLMIVTCATGAQAQRLNRHKKSHRGTVAEQIAKASIKNNPAEQVRELLAYAFTFKGTPYVYGAMSPAASTAQVSRAMCSRNSAFASTARRAGR